MPLVLALIQTFAATLLTILSIGSLLSYILLTPFVPRRITAFGSGKQIEAHLDLFLRQFPSIADVTIINRTINDRTASLKQVISSMNHPSSVHFLASQAPGSEADIQSAVRQADVIICATPSTQPLFPSSWVRTATHVVLIGSYKPEMKEVDRELILRALLGKMVVDSREASLQEAGELIDAKIHADQLMEIGELISIDKLGVAAKKTLIPGGRTENTETGFDGPVTLFKSVGLGIQDVAMASAIVEKALAWEGEKIGTVVSDYDA